MRLSMNRSAKSSSFIVVGAVGTRGQGSARESGTLERNEQQSLVEHPDMQRGTQPMDYPEGGESMECSPSTDASSSAQSHCRSVG